MKLKNITITQGGIISLVLAILMVLIGLLILGWYYERAAPIYGIFFILGLILFGISVTLFMIKLVRYSRELEKRKEEYLLIIQLVKWTHIVGIFGYILLFSFSIFSQRNYFRNSYNQITPNITDATIYAISVIAFILSILIVYGIMKKNWIGYYGGITYFFGGVFTIFISYIINHSVGYILISIIPLLLYVLFGYYFYKGRKYFRLNLKK